MNNAIKNHIKQRHVTIHLLGPVVRYNSLNVTKIHANTITGHEKRTDMQNN